MLDESYLLYTIEKKIRVGARRPAALFLHSFFCPQKQVGPLTHRDLAVLHEQEGPGDEMVTHDQLRVDDC